MDEKIIYYDYVNICDDKVFTKERLYKWEKHIVSSYEKVFKKIKEKMNADSPILFNLNLSLLYEVVIDAVIGMKKITESQYNSVEEPNAFKIAAYLSYWWLRHKPVSVHYPVEYAIEDVNLKNPSPDEDLNEKECNKLAWQLKHINELVAVQMVATFVFDFSKVVCDGKICSVVKKKEQGNFCFVSFEEMRDELLKKLTYYFSYRAIAPKMIEHLLEAYTFHPAWGLTGPQWKVENKEVK